MRRPRRRDSPEDLALTGYRPDGIVENVPVDIGRDLVSNMPQTDDIHPPATVAEEPVVVTPAAAEQMKELCAREDRAGQGIRIWVRDGGCSGMSYAMDFAPAPADNDIVIRRDGALLFVDGAALPYLKGTTIDYVTGLHHAGFRFVNPQANRTCGCGESFSV